MPIRHAWARAAAFTCRRLTHLCSSKEADEMGRLCGRHLITVGIVTMLAGVGATSAWGSESVHARAPVSARSSSVHHRARGGHSPRVGGRVHSAWPKAGRAPKTQLDRWLARQVGATKPLACAKRWRKARKRCHLAAPKRRHHHVTGDAVMSTALGDPGSPPGQLAKIVNGTRGGGRLLARASDASSLALPLQLVRSYQIPADDPLYNSLSNWSWTYDSAVAAAAFAATGAQANSAQLLDQLTALQHADGSIELAFNTATGDSAPIFRSGTVAWVGLAASAYDLAFGSSRYLVMEQRSADYLLSLQTNSGLIKGGPDVSWVSTEHNLITYVFLSRLASELRGNGSTAAAAQYQSAAATISAAIDAQLLVSDASGTHFLQGLNDPTQALDVQALGAMYLQGTGRPDLAAQVLAYAQTNFAIDNRSVGLSADPASYNMTYSAAGPFAGYRPYAGAGAPDVLWAEGSGQMRLAEAALGQDTKTLDQSISNWTAITSGQNQGPLQADRTYTGYGVQYHVWPASTAAAWTALADSSPAFFAAPLPPTTTLVNQWTAVRGGNLISTFPDGRVVMNTGSGERRVLAGPPTATNYTVTSNATLNYGSGYGIYVRATVDSGTKLTGYCVQLDHTYPGLIVRLIQSDLELTVPLARLTMPASFDWNAPHVMSITVNGNTMGVTVDGSPMITIPSLTAAAATAAKGSSGVTTPIVAPAAGGYGLRAWSAAQVTLQQMTVTGAG
jgi:hypothetical protein